MSLAAIVGEYQGRAAVALNHASRRDADDAAVPSLAINHDAVCIAEFRFLFEALRDGLENSALFFLALAVELVEATGDFFRAYGIFHAEELYNVTGNVHAAGGVQTRRDAESNSRRGCRAICRDLSHLEKCLQPGIHRT